MKKYTCAAAAVALLLSTTAFAASELAQAQERYRQERKACMTGQSNQDRATCLKEAGAALQEAKRGALSAGGSARLQANREARCAKLPATDREECIARMREGSTSGTAREGGVLRELVTPVPTR